MLHVLSKCVVGSGPQERARRVEIRDANRERSVGSPWNREVIGFQVDHVAEAGRGDRHAQGAFAAGAAGVLGRIQAAMSVTTASATWPGLSYSAGALGPAPSMKRWFSFE